MFPDYHILNSRYYDALLDRKSFAILRLAFAHTRPIAIDLHTAILQEIHTCSYIMKI